MSKENAKKFYEALKADNALVEELNDVVDVAILQFAAKQNLAFTAEEAVEVENEARKLSNEELDSVNAAGGNITCAQDASEDVRNASVEMSASPFRRVSQVRRTFRRFWRQLFS